MEDITKEEVRKIELAKKGGEDIPKYLSEKIEKIISSDDLEDKDRICCRYYSHGRFRYAMTSSANCAVVVGDTVDERFCGKEKS